MRNRKIYFECTALVADHFSGVGHYVKGIAQAWDRYLASPEHAAIQKEKKTRYTTLLIASKNRMRHLDKFRLEHMLRRPLFLPARIIHKLLYFGLMPPLDLLGGRGVYLFTNFMHYPLLRSKSATVVYDISYEVVPQYSDGRLAQFLSKLVRKAIKKSNLIITISNYTKKELVEFYGLDPKKVIVAYPAVDRRHFYHRSGWEIDKVKRTYELPDNYVLFVGNIEPRKNLTTLIDAYTKLPHEYSKKYPLVLVGVNAWRNEAIFEKLEKARQNGYTIARPKTYVSDDDIPAVISGASMMVYPSHYEGFGMPPLEAMSCGVPVITSDNTSLPEVVGDAGILIKSDDEEGITKAMIKVMSDKSLRESMIEKGYTQSRKFSWDESAQKIYKAVVGL
jgi:glycosyltransferase involved in cell wall biosynthesis